MSAPRRRGSRLAPLLALCLAAPGARAFSVGAPPLPDALAAAPRWCAEPVEDAGLHDGIQVAVHPSLPADLGAVEPLDIELLREGVEQAFRAWENGAVRFEIEHDSPEAVFGLDGGAEIDVLTLAGDHPLFEGTPYFGLAALRSAFAPARLLTNGARADGLAIVRADIYLNATRLRETQEQFGLPVGIAVIALTRLLMHEAGHALGFLHPTDAPNLDQDLDPLDAETVDPLDPFAGLVESPYVDVGAIMSNEPCGGPFVELCAALFYQELRADDRLGRDVMYPVPEPGSARAASALALALAATSARRGRSRGSRAR